MLKKLKIAETIALVMLNISILISWMAYNEFNPKIVEKFNIGSVAHIIVILKSIILIIIPILSGFLTDYIFRKSKNFFLISLVGIVAAGMTFLSIATLAPFGQTSFTFFILPILIVVWLVAMNLFVSPANSLVDLFAPKSKLPILMAILLVSSEITNAFEPLIISFIQSIGVSLTFIVGGIAVVGSGIFFIRQTKDEVLESREFRLQRQQDIKYYMVIVIGLSLGLAQSFIYNVLPKNLSELMNGGNFSEQFISTFILIAIAIFSIPVSTYWKRREIQLKSIYVAIAFSGLGGMTLFLLSSPLITFFNAILIIYAYVTLSIVGLPYIISRLDGKKVTLGIGIFFGAAQVFNSIFDLLK